MPRCDPSGPNSDDDGDDESDDDAGNVADPLTFERRRTAEDIQCSTSLTLTSGAPGLGSCVRALDSEEVDCEVDCDAAAAAAAAAKAGHATGRSQLWSQL